MGCGALRAMPCGRTSTNHCHIGAVSTRKPPKGTLGWRRSLDDSTTEQAFGARLSAQAWQQDTALPPSACADVDEHAAQPQWEANANRVGSASSSASSTRIGSASSFGGESSGADASPVGSGSAVVVTVAPPQASSSTKRPAGGLGGANAGKAGEDAEWEPPPSGTLLKCETSSTRRTPARTRASPLGALTTPLVPRGGNSSASTAVQAETLRPAVVGEPWPQADDSDAGMELRSTTSASPSTTSPSTGTASPTPMQTAAVASVRPPATVAGSRTTNGAAACAGVASPESCSDCGASSVDASTSTIPGSTGAAGHSAMRKGSNCSALSGVSTAVAAQSAAESRETEEGSIRDWVTVDESDSAAADDLLAREPPPGAEISEEHSESVSGVGVGSDGSVHSVGAEAGNDLEFMLERPFFGLETILEESDLDQPASSSRVPKSPSFQARGSFSGSRLCGQPGPLGFPESFSAEMMKPLNTIEPLSAEKMRPTLCQASSGQASSSNSCLAHQGPQGSLGELKPQISSASAAAAHSAASNVQTADSESDHSDSQ
mmetsp:Transcript_4295/g.7143  ORF Transcript_4295/g.7143 Transcript_4295/m.7143 type:complete len:549 (-) Transcript_4295:52-1698(-)